MSLITQSDMSTYVHEMSTNIESTKVTPYIDEAQEFDIKQILGELMYYDLITNPTSTANAKLLGGGNYTHNNYNYTFRGLKAAIAYFAFGRMIPFLGYNITRSGIKTKTNNGLDGQVSNDADRKELGDFSTSCKNKAIAIIDDCKKFIERNSTDYPLYRINDSISHSTTRIGAVGKSITRGKTYRRCNNCNRLNCRCVYTV